MKYSFVIPCYRSESTIESVVKEVESAVKENNILDYEIIMVNDCSPDGVWNVIKRLVERDSHNKGVSLAKNFGQHSALMAGYSKVTGDIVVSLDDDGQTPIDELGSLIEKLDEGNDVVFAYYDEIKQNTFRKFGSFVAIQMCKIILNAPSNFRASSFYAARRFVIDEIVKYKNAYPYITGLILRTTGRLGYVKTSQRERAKGVSGYSFRRLFGLWMNGFTAFSVKPLEIGIWVGVCMSIIGLIGALVTIINKFIYTDIPIGWSSLISVILIVGGMILLMLGLIGEYIGRIYICINKSPQYVIEDEKINEYEN